jgi:hypothetical protein
MPLDVLQDIVEAQLAADGKQRAPLNPHDLHTVQDKTESIDLDRPSLQMVLIPLQLMRRSAVSQEEPIV